MVSLPLVWSIGEKLNFLCCIFKAWTNICTYYTLEHSFQCICRRGLSRKTFYVNYYFLCIYSFPGIKERLENLQLGVHFTWVITNCPSSCFTTCFTTAVISCIVVLVKVYLKAVAYIELVCWKKCILFDLRNKDSLFEYYEVGLYDTVYIFKKNDSLFL